MAKKDGDLPFPQSPKIIGEQALHPNLSINPTQTDWLYAGAKIALANVDLIPSNLELFGVEYALAAGGVDGGAVSASRLRKLKQGLRELARDYDVVLLVPSPACGGTIDLAVMRAANALLVPLAAAAPDFCSTVHSCR